MAVLPALEAPGGPRDIKIKKVLSIFYLLCGVWRSAVRSRKGE